MPRRKKQARELTKDEAMKKMFPKKVRDEAYKIAHEKDDKGKPASLPLGSQVGCLPHVAYRDGTGRDGAHPVAESLGATPFSLTHYPLNNSRMVAAAASHSTMDAMRGRSVIRRSSGLSPRSLACTRKMYLNRPYTTKGMVSIIA